jgi:sugar lactone lactonase YvrE
MSDEARKTVFPRALFFNAMIFIGAAIAVLGALSTPLLNAQTPVAPQITYRWETTVFSLSSADQWSIAVDASGNVFIADHANNRVLKAAPQPDGSYVSSVIVTGLYLPQGIAVDAGGNVYISDTFHEKIVKVSPNPDGSYSSPTVLLSGIAYPDGLAVDASGNLYYTNCAWAQVYVLPSGSNSASEIGAGFDGFNCPNSIAVDGGGNLYITDESVGVFKETWSATGGEWPTPIGRYSVSKISPALPSPSTPMGIAVDASGNNIYVADDAKVVRETWSGSGYTQTTLADAGTELTVNPSSVALDSSGNIYIGEQAFTANKAAGWGGYGAVLKETLSGAGPDVGDAPIDGAGPLSLLTFLFNDTVTLNDTTPLMVLTNGASREDFIDVSASAGLVLNQCKAGTTFTAGQYCQVLPEFAPWMLSGNRNGAVVLYDSSGAPIATAYMHGTALGSQVAFLPGTEIPEETQVPGVQKVAVDDNGNIYTNNGVSVQMDANNTTTEIGNFQQANAIAVDGSGNLYVTDPTAHELRKETFNLDGSYVENLLAQESYALYGVAVDGAGNVYFTGGGGNVFELTPTQGGGYTENAISTSAGNQPLAIAVDGGGNLYIADFTNARVLKETPSASGYTESVTADNNSSPYPLSGPLDVAVDGNGNVYILDSTNYSVIRETPSGGAYVQSLVVQSGAIYGFGQLMGIAVDPFGNVYIADNTFAKVVMEDIFDPPRIYFETVTDGSTSQPQSVQVINNGNQTLTAVDSGLVVAGTTKAGDFIQVHGSGTPTDCAADFSIDPGLACNLSLEFAPSSVESGTITGAATLTDNSLDGTTSPQTIFLTGTAQVASQAPAITSAGGTTFTVGTAGTFTVTATGTPTATLSESGTLPNVVTFNPSTGALSGTPAAGTGGTYNITFGAKNGVSPDATQNFTLTVNEAPTITSANSSMFTVGTNGSFTVQATGYPAPTFSETGTLPGGVTLNASTGVLGGMPASGAGGSYPITVTASNGIGTDATQNFTLTVDEAPAITSVNSVTFTVGAIESFTVTTTGYPAPTFSETGAMPSGVTLDSTIGVLSGNPGSGTGGSYPITITVSNGVSPKATQNFTLAVDEALTITSADSTTFTVGTASTFTVTATGYPSPKLSESGMLPKGVTFNASTGTLSGTPLASYGGTYTITFTAKNDLSPYATQSFTLTVDEAPAISSANNATFTVGASGNFPVTATGYPAPTFSESGTLPGVVTLVDNKNGTATLSGTPASGTGGSYPITITAANGVLPNDTQNFKLTVNEAPGISSANNTMFAVGATGTFTVTTTGYPAPSLTETGALPIGVTLTDNGNGTARLAGTPAAGTSGSYPITITASNGVGTNATQTFTLMVNTAPAITSANNATCTTGAWWSFTVTATGTPTPALSESGALPGGMTFNPSTGVLAGTPAAGSGGTYNITLTASNGIGTDAKQNFTLTVDQAPAITSANSTTFKVGAAGTFTVTATGYPASLSLGETGALPGGVTFNAATGVLSGTPAAGTGGTYNITFTASNGVLPIATQNFTLNVTSAVLSSITVAPANGSVPTGLTQQFTATGHYSDGSTQDVTSGVTWTSSATFVARITSGGLATGVAQGRTTITAAQGSIRGSSTLTVIAPLLQSIDARPSNASIFTGQSQQYVALGHFSDGSAQNISDTARWSSSNVSIATINSGGSAKGVGVGTITITATRGGVSGTASLTVNPMLVSITVTPANPSIKVGIKTQFTATGTYSDRSTKDLTMSARWTSSNTFVATINTAGLATGASVGRTTIRATVGQTSGTTLLTVTR